MGSVLEAIPRGPGRTELDKERQHRGEAEGFEAERYGVPTHWLLCCSISGPLWTHLESQGRRPAKVSLFYGR